MNKFCQSCGMPMKKDPEGGGTNGDGSRSPDYCSFCFGNGAFTSPEIKTAADMQRFCIGKWGQRVCCAFGRTIWGRIIGEIHVPKPAAMILPIMILPSIIFLT